MTSPTTRPGGSKYPILNDGMFDRPAAAWLSIVRQLLDDQVELCLAFERLSTEQTELLRTGLIDEMLVLLAQREELLGRIVDIQQALAPFHARHAEAMTGLSNSDRVSIQGRLNAVAGVIERIRVRDDADRKALEQQRQAVADELAGISRLRGAAAAYAGASSGYSHAQPARYHGPQG